MDRFRNFKNRLSVSVDKLSPNRRAMSPPSNNRRSIVLPDTTKGVRASASADVIRSSPSSPGVPMRKRRANRSKRPNSIEESDVEDTCNSANTSSYMDTSNEVVASSAHAKEKIPLVAEQLKKDEISVPAVQDPPITPTGYQGSESLVAEVMKEVKKIEMISEDIQRRDISSSDGADKATNLEDKIDFIDSFEANEEDQVAEKPVSQNTSFLDMSRSSDSVTHSASSKTKLASISSVDQSLSISSTLHAESLTSGYLSDTPSESSSANKSKAPKTVFSTLSSIEDKPPPKKESIYSRLLKKKEKDPPEVKQKEPIYARIKPKLKLDTSFKPIEPSSCKSSDVSPVIKPEPIYSKVKQRATSSTICQDSLPSPSSATVLSSSPRSSFSPLSPNGEPLYSKITPKSSTLPTGNNQSVHTTVRESKTFPRDIPLDSPRAKYPIYTQPLPALPISQEKSLEERSRSKELTRHSLYSKVTVRAKEISPVRPDVITINNPGYVPSFPASSSQEKNSSIKESIVALENPANDSKNSIHPTPPVSPPNRRAKPSSTFLPLNINAASNIQKSQDLPSNGLPPKSPNSKESLTKNLEEHGRRGSGAASKSSLVGSDSYLTLDSDFIEPSGRTLSRLVEELAIELEAVSRRIGDDVDLDDEKSKKEMLSKLLATYDVPKNLRRVPEVDEDEVLQSEQCMISARGSADELRFVDDRVQTFYADIPDYSQDEFVIALDDENDPKYASLTHEMRQEQQNQQRRAVDMSPGKVSRRSAQVYVNVVNVLSALKVLVNSNSNRAASVITRMGTIARPYAKKVQTSVQTSIQKPSTDPSWIQRRIYHISVSALWFIIYFS